MNFWQLSDGIRLHHQPTHGHDGHGTPAPGRPDLSHHPMIDTGDDSAGDGGGGVFTGVAINSPVAFFDPANAAHADIHAHADAYQSNAVQIDQHTDQMAGIGGYGGSGNLGSFPLKSTKRSPGSARHCGNEQIFFPHGIAKQFQGHRFLAGKGRSSRALAPTL